MANIPIITIDGPSGSGKGTVAYLLAQQLDWHYLDSGALYRVLAYAAQQYDIEISDTEKLVQLARQLPVTFDVSGAYLKVLLEQHEITQMIRSEQMGNRASKIAAIAVIRDALLARQRAFCQLPGLVTDGRDMGTVVFPEAKYKVFLDADAAERAKRRHKQLKEKGIESNLSQLIDEINERDRRDKTRPIAPLVAANDATIIDSTSLTIDEVLTRIRTICTDTTGAQI